MISHICLYPPYCSHLHPPSLSFSSTTLLSSQNTKSSHPSLSLHVMIMSWHRVQHSPSTAFTEYSIHRVQHSPSTAFTEYSIHGIQHTPKIVCLPCILMITSWPPDVASACGMPPSMTDRHQRAFHESSMVKSHSDSCELTNWWKESQHAARLPSTASKYSSKLARLRPPSSHNHRLQVPISKLARSRPPSISANSLDYSLQLRTIMASMCIYTLAWSRPPSASPNLLNHNLQVYVYTRPITASKFTRSRPPSASPNSLDHGLRVYLWVYLIVIFRRTLNCTQALPAASPDIPCVDG